MLKDLEARKTYQKKYRETHKEQHRLHASKYAQRHRDLLCEKTKEWRLKNPEKIKAYRKQHFQETYKPHPRPRLKFLTSEEQTAKRKARVKAQTALKKGILSKETCVFCGSEKTQMHHPDYSKSLEVVWTCRTHHLEIHRIG